MPASMPADRERVQQPPFVVAHQRRDLHDHPGDRADADAEEQRRETGVEGGGADPGAEHRRRPGDQPERHQMTEASPGVRPGALAQRRDDRQALGGVVDREANNQEGAEGERPGGVGRADRQALAEVVQADPDRDQQGHVEPAL